MPVEVPPDRLFCLGFRVQGFTKVYDQVLISRWTAVLRYTWLRYHGSYPYSRVPVFWSVALREEKRRTAMLPFGCQYPRCVVHVHT